MTEVVKSIDPCRCCWHCKYYIRPVKFGLDGPATELCTIDRKRDRYPVYGEASPGDKNTPPDDYCDRFEIDPPPKQ